MESSIDIHIPPCVKQRAGRKARVTPGAQLALCGDPEAG